MRHFLGILCVMAAVLVGCGGGITPIIPIETGTPVPNAVGNVINLNQGWDEKLQSQFWFTTQGSRTVPYDWFLVLEQANSQELFRSDDNIERLRYLPAKPDNKWNPDGLPVGLAKTEKDENGQHWVGPTCAFCHTTQVNYKGVGLRIDGGGTMGDFNTFLSDLVAALRATNDDDAKFKRFANKVLGEPHSPPQQKSLREELGKATEQLAASNALHTPTHEAGYARLDAFGRIFNNVLVTALDQPDNVEPPNAPVSYPFLWDTPQHDVVQWNGAAPNSPAGLGPLARNVGEIIGVFGGLHITEGEIEEIPKYDNNIHIKNLGELEKWLESLWSPQWPKDYLEAIDPVKAGKGQVHYEKYCQQCHASIDRTSPKRRVKAIMIPVKDGGRGTIPVTKGVGTDPGMATVGATRTGTTGILEGKRKSVIAGDKFGSTAKAVDLLTNTVIGSIVSDPIEVVESLITDHLKVRKAQSFDAISYKGRPLNGIWATAPYLHNGSVPNLWELLKAPDDRVKTFHVGSREFDPQNVGFETQEFPGSYRFDTSLDGNSNGGHDYGTSELSDEQKWELIEYLKTL